MGYRVAMPSASHFPSLLRTSFWNFPVTSDVKQTPPRSSPPLPHLTLPPKGASYSWHPWLLGELRPRSCRACLDHLRVISSLPSTDRFQNSVFLEHLVELECLGSWETTRHTWTNQSVFPEMGVQALLSGTDLGKWQIQLSGWSRRCGGYYPGALTPLGSRGAKLSINWLLV